MQHISVSDFKEHIDGAENPPLLIDVREPWEYALCHIDNSTLIPMSQVPNVINKLSREQETFLICHHGVRSQRVGLLLKDSGFEKIVNVAGGINAWARQVDLAMSTY
jgi:rhodanese-related sulfurtransferase